MCLQVRVKTAGDEWIQSAVNFINDRGAVMSFSLAFHFPSLLFLAWLLMGMWHQLITQTNKMFAFMWHRWAAKLQTDWWNYGKSQAHFRPDETHSVKSAKHKITYFWYWLMYGDTIRVTDASKHAWTKVAANRLIRQPDLSGKWNYPHLHPNVGLQHSYKDYNIREVTYLMPLTCAMLWWEILDREEMTWNYKKKNKIRHKTIQSQ